MALTIEAALAAAASQLTDSHTAALDAQCLLAHVLEKPRSYLYTWADRELTDEQQLSFNLLIEKRRNGEPVAYLMGERDFWTLTLKVTPDTLIPRPDTERLVELALSCELPVGNVRIADLGTGSGAIALALAHERPQWQVLAVDQSEGALNVAQQNAQLNNLQNVSFVLGNWCEPLDNGLQMIVSNPPYIREDDPHLQQGDVRFEPITALVAHDDGLKDIRDITAQAAVKLADDGWLLFEHGYNQGEAVRKILTAAGFEHVRTEQDLAGHDRVTLGQYPSR